MVQLLFLEKMHKECPSRGAGCPKAEQSGAAAVETGRKCPWSGYNFQQCGRFHTDLSVLATPDEQSVDSLAVVGARLRRQMDIGLDKAAAAGRRKSGRKMTAGVEICRGLWKDQTFNRGGWKAPEREEGKR